MTSSSFDGEYIARIIELFGYVRRRRVFGCII